MNDDNVIRRKGYEFALDIIKFVNCLPKGIAGYVLGSQLLRSATSIGANIEEAIGADSKKDFSYKMGIAKREARESKYWLQLIGDSDLVKDNNGLIEKAEELVRILTSIVKTSQNKCCN
jgi:four helix bundle protein